METEQLPRQLIFSRLSGGWLCWRRRQAHRIRPVSAQSAFKLRKFAESTHRCGETTEHGAPGVVRLGLSDSFAE